MIITIVIEELFNGWKITMRRDEKTLIQYDIFEPYTSDIAIKNYICYHLGTIKIK